MVGISVAIGFVGMVLAPCAVGLYSKWGESAELSSNGSRPSPPALETGGAQPFFPENPSPNSEMTATPRPIGLAAVPSLREVAQLAAREVRTAQAAAAKAKVDALMAASRTASRRAASAERLAQAAELELSRASRALAQAEATKAKAKQKRAVDDRNYLPLDHPSLDFPRSRVAPHRAA